MDIQSIIESSKAIGYDTIPVIGGSSQYADAILTIFESNPSKHYSGSEIKKLFASEGVEIKNPSAILFQLHKKGKLTRPTTGWYILK